MTSDPIWRISEDAALNFYPYYREVVESRKKHLTIRLANKADRFKEGQIVRLTLGWDERTAEKVARARIEQVRIAKIGELTKDDLTGESPDCSRPEAIKYVLSSIYRTIVGDDDEVTLIRWQYLD